MKKPQEYQALMLPKDLHHEIKKQAVDEELSLIDFTEKMLRDYQNKK